MATKVSCELCGGDMAQRSHFCDECDEKLAAGQVPVVCKVCVQSPIGGLGVTWKQGDVPLGDPVFSSVILEESCPVCTGLALTESFVLGGEAHGCA